MRRFCAVSFLVVCLLILVAGCGPTTMPTAATESLEWKLAVIRTGNSNLPKDAPLVSLFAEHLDSLTAKVKQDRQETADAVVRCWRILREDVDPKEDLLDVFIALDECIPDEAAELELDLVEIAAVYIILRIGD